MSPAPYDYYKKEAWKNKIRNTLKAKNIRPPSSKGIHRSDIFKKKVSMTMKDKAFWKGKHLPEEIKEKISNTLKEHIPWNKGLLGWNVGFKHSVETKKKLSIIKKNIKFSKRHIENLRKSHLGYIPTLEQRRKIGLKHKGKQVSSETKKKMSLAQQGEKSHCWLGGKSYKEYSKEFKPIREIIRQRDNYKCKICGAPQIECIQKLSVHHINYDKKNINFDNLITLCKNCHQKTNFNRDYWKNYFKEEINVK